MSSWIRPSNFSKIWRSLLHPWCKWSAFTDQQWVLNKNLAIAVVLYAGTIINAFSRALAQHTTIIKCWCPYYTCWFNSWKDWWNQYRWVAACWQEHYCRHPTQEDQSIQAQLSGSPALCIKYDQVDSICTDCSNLGMKIIWNLTGTTTKKQARAFLLLLETTRIYTVGGSYLTMHNYPGNILIWYFYINNENKNGSETRLHRIWFENCLIWLTSPTHSYARKNHSYMF
jgi:hypothetical protein